ncbi:MAG: glycosyltransferase family 4 protein [Planctomycetota bacterium]
MSSIAFANSPTLHTDGDVAQALPAVPAIGILVPEFPSQTHVFFWREVVALRSAGASIDLISTRKPPDDACRHDFAQEARSQSHYIWPPRVGSTTRLLASPRNLARGLAYVRSLDESSVKQKARVTALLSSAVDLVTFCQDRNVRHIHCHSFADAAHVCAVAHLFGGPTYSLTLHGDLPVYGTDHRRKLEHCTAVGCDGPHLVPQLESLGYPTERVLPNWMGVDTSRFAPSDHDSEEGCLRVITVARLNINKGHRFALRAMKRLVEAGRDIRYTLVGDGKIRDELRQEIRRLDLTDRVVLTGALGEDDVRRELLANDVFCLPSVGLGEAGPISVMEAMACGLPVIASRIGATPQMIRDGETGFLCHQQDVDGLAEAFDQLATDPARSQSMGRAARAYAVDNFDSRRTSLRLFAHIRRWTPETFRA